MSKSLHVCRRCQHPVHETASGWRHNLGGRSSTESCGRPPEVLERAVVDAEAEALAEPAVWHLRRLGGQRG